jgi:hypothetical protein
VEGDGRRWRMAMVCLPLVPFLLPLPPPLRGR